MTKMMEELYYIMEDYVDRNNMIDEEAKKLETRQEALQEEIILRLGEGGQELMEALADLNLRLETIHDQALFRAAMGLGARIARPGGPYSTSL